jgi:phycoerythrocyanin alpha-cysteine-84 phycoviolobilin lyase/isomerase subunit PecF
MTMNTFNSENTKLLILQLDNASTPEIAIAAIQDLGASETPEPAAINALIQVLSHHHPTVCAASVKVLVQLAPATVKPLITVFNAVHDQGLQAYIIQALAQIGDPEALDLLAEVVGTAVANHCQGNVRRIAARGLGLIGHNSGDTTIIQRVEEKLIWALFTPEDWGLRYAAAVSLAQMATPASCVALKQAIVQEADQVVRTRMLTALETLIAAAA